MTRSREESFVESLESRRLLHAGHDHGTVEELHLVASEDAHVRGAQYASTNYGSASDMEVKLSSQGVYDRDAFLRFDLTSLDAETIDSVQLRLFAGSSQPSSSTVVPSAVRLAAATWSESTITYANAPAFTGAALGALEIVGAKKWFTVDVTQAVVNALQAGATSIAFGVEGTKSVSPFAVITSSESTTNQPELVALVGDGTPPTDPPPVADAATLPAVDDAHVNGGSNANINFGSDQQLQVKYSSTGTYQRFGYIRFDVSTLAGKTVPSATLRLWGQTSQNNTTTVSVMVGGATNEWVESTITFNNRPAIVGGTFGTIKLASTGKWFEVNVTPYVQAAVNAEQTSISFSLSGVSSTSPFGLINSSEATTNRPELRIGDGGTTTTPQPIAWTASATGPIRREEAVTFDFGGRMFVLGGYVDHVTYVATQRMDVFDPVANTWSRLNDAPTKLTHVGTAIDTQTATVWMVGGLIGDFPEPLGTNVVWKYSPATDTWDRGPDLPEGRFAGGAAIVGRTLYYFGGSDETRSSDKLDTWALDLDTPDASWQSVASMPTARNHFGYATVGTRVYVIGGQTGLQSESITQNGVLMYDTLTDTWSQVAPLPRVHGHFHASSDVYKDRYILISGGDAAHNVPVDDVYLYDTQTNMWTQLTDLPDARRAPVGRIIGDVYYVGTGFNRSGGFTDLMWKADLTALALA